MGESFEERSAVELSWRLEVIDGYGVEVFIPKTVAVDSRLLALCQRYAIPAQEPS